MKVGDIEVIEMKLAKCPNCDELINLDLIKPLGLTLWIGCGLKEDFFEPCKGCSMKNDAKECKSYRDKEGLTPTTVGDMSESGHFNRLYIATFDNIRCCIKCGTEFDPVSVWYAGTIHEKYLTGLCGECAKEQ